MVSIFGRVLEASGWGFEVLGGLSNFCLRSFVHSAIDFELFGACVSVSSFGFGVLQPVHPFIDAGFELLVRFGAKSSKHIRFESILAILCKTGILEHPLSSTQRPLLPTQHPLLSTQHPFSILDVL